MVQTALVAKASTQSELEAKRESTVVREVMARIGEKSASARSLFLQLDSDHDGKLSHAVRT